LNGDGGLAKKRRENCARLDGTGRDRMTLVIVVVVLAIFFSLTMAGAWLVALRTGQSGWIDAIWSFATGVFGAVAALLPFAAGEISSRQMLVAVLALLWSLRLGIHIAARTAGGGDDPRYRHLREQWGSAFRSRLFWFLQIQASAAFVLVLSIMIAAQNPAPGLKILDGLGIAILIVAVVGETIADRQLSAFRLDPRNQGKVCDVGLWGRSRHPNYFFEWLGWLAYAVIAIDLTGAYPQGWLAFAGPLLMYFLLVHASGIPPLEGHMLRSRGKAFREYQHRVNAFWPGPQNGAGTA
jgi:steroid 5-alpha reductase family enzyme